MQIRRQKSLGIHTLIHTALQLGTLVNLFILAELWTTGISIFAILKLMPVCDRQTLTLFILKRIISLRLLLVYPQDRD